MFGYNTHKKKKKKGERIASLQPKTWRLKQNTDDCWATGPVILKVKRDH